jgi:hypothetical protein
VYKIVRRAILKGVSKPSQPSPAVAGADHARLQKLAKGIEALAGKDQLLLERTRQIGEFRRLAAAELYTVCANFVDNLNAMLRSIEVEIDPPRDSAIYRETGPNLIQINARGRILEIDFRATDEMLSTEDFRIPYTLGGTVRAFNQEFLDKNLIEEQCLFFTVEGTKRFWRYFDPRTHRSGAFDQAFLISMMELLI